LLLGRRQGPFGHLNVVFFGQPFKRFVVPELLVFHDEMNHVSTFAATETLADALGGETLKEGVLSS
jgi:hypothetical protein